MPERRRLEYRIIVESPRPVTREEEDRIAGWVLAQLPPLEVSIRQALGLPLIDRHKIVRIEEETGQNG